MTETLKVKVTCETCGKVWRDTIDISAWSPDERRLVRESGSGNLTRPDCPACTQYLFIDGKLVREEEEYERPCVGCAFHPFSKECHICGKNNDWRCFEDKQPREKK